ncbi:MAG: hypothetical protein Q9221_008491 [Calogaya cf. arnoldii]
MPNIYWTAPSLMLASLIVGTLFALGHHLFYASLDHKQASTSLAGYYVLGMHISIQQFNTAVGTAFAFLVRAFSGNIDKIRRLLPIASIITPATLSVGVDFPPPMYMNVPNVDFSSLNLAAPMTTDGPSDSSDSSSNFFYKYTGPSLTVRRITDAVAAQGSILPVAAPAVNSTWSLDFNAPSLHCHPVEFDFRHEVLANILEYTFARSRGTIHSNCTYGPGYVAWHPSWMPTLSNNKYLPLIIDNLNLSRSVLNHDISPGYVEDMASIFFAITPTLFSSNSDEGGPTMCQSEPWYEAGLATYHNTSTVLRCDVYNSTYHTNFSFVNGVQDVHVNNVTDITDTPMITTGQVHAFFESLDQSDTSLRPHPCPPQSFHYNDNPICLFDLSVLATLSYQAVMHAFTGLLAGMISLGDRQDHQDMITSTTQLSSTVLAKASELAFLQNTQTHNQRQYQSLQERAATWEEQPFAGLVNTAAASRLTLSFQQALEQLFQNITISLMSAPDLQPNTSSVYYPDKTEVQLTTRENIYIYAASKLWLAYGLAVGATALIALLGIAAIIANDASFTDRFSTMLRLSRGAQLSFEINHADLSGRDPLPAYAKQATVRFSPEQTSGTRARNDYTLVEREGKEDEHEVTIQERHSEQS